MSGLSDILFGRSAKRRVLREPQVIQGSQPMQQETGFGYRLEEHYNTELDPTVSYIKAYVGPNGQTDWHRLKGESEPIESRFYVLHGEGHFELYDAARKTKPYVYELQAGDSLLVPDGFWRRFSNPSEQSVLEALVICTPRWTPDAFEATKAEMFQLED